MKVDSQIAELLHNLRGIVARVIYDPKFPIAIILRKDTAHCVHNKVSLIVGRH
jgi:hypothetical protein